MNKEGKKVKRNKKGIRMIEEIYGLRDEVLCTNRMK